MIAIWEVRARLRTTTYSVASREASIEVWGRAPLSTEIFCGLETDYRDTPVRPKVFPQYDEPQWRDWDAWSTCRIEVDTETGIAEAYVDEYLANTVTGFDLSQGWVARLQGGTVWIVYSDGVQPTAEFDDYSVTAPEGSWSDDFSGSVIDARWTVTQSVLQRVDAVQAGGVLKIVPKAISIDPFGSWVRLEETWAGTPQPPVGPGEFIGEDDVAKLLTGHHVFAYIDGEALKVDVYEPGSASPDTVTVVASGVTDDTVGVFVDHRGRAVVITPTGTIRKASTTPWDSGSWSTWDAT